MFCALKEAAVNGIPFKKLLPVVQTPPPDPVRPPIPVSQNAPQPQDLDKLQDDITIVTAYFNLGPFQKGDTQPANFTPFLYHSWIHVFARIENPVVAYFERDEDVQLFQRIRARRFPENQTRVYKASRSDLWSFGLLPLIQKIYKKDGYPKYHPGTVVPEYSATMHAKYELVHRTALENPFKTKYFSWLDVGLFRSVWEGSKEPNFWLYLPPNFDPTKVAYAEVFNRSTGIDPKRIFILNKEWVCGCIFIGRIDTMIKWTEQYMNATEKYLQKGYMNTDQQVLYSMANEGYPIEMQVYQKPAEYEAWFHLGYTCMEEGAKRRKLLTGKATWSLNPL